MSETGNKTVVNLTNMPLLWCTIRKGKYRLFMLYGGGLWSRRGSSCPCFFFVSVRGAIQDSCRSVGIRVWIFCVLEQFKIHVARVFFRETCVFFESSCVCTFVVPVCARMYRSYFVSYFVSNPGFPVCL